MKYLEARATVLSELTDEYEGIREIQIRLYKRHPGLRFSYYMIQKVLRSNSGGLNAAVEWAMNGGPCINHDSYRRSAAR